MAIMAEPMSDMTFTFVVGDGIYGFIESESFGRGEALTVGVWDGWIIFGPTAASPLECTLLLAAPLLLMFAVGLCGALLWRSNRLKRPRG